MLFLAVKSWQVAGIMYLCRFYKENFKKTLHTGFDLQYIIQEAKNYGSLANVTAHKEANGAKFLLRTHLISLIFS